MQVMLPRAASPLPAPLLFPASALSTPRAPSAQLVACNRPLYRAPALSLRRRLRHYPAGDGPVPAPPVPLPLATTKLIQLGRPIPSAPAGRRFIHKSAPRRAAQWPRSGWQRPGEVRSGHRTSTGGQGREGRGRRCATLGRTGAATVN